MHETVASNKSIGVLQDFPHTEQKGSFLPGNRVLPVNQWSATKDCLVKGLGRVPEIQQLDVGRGQDLTQPNPNPLNRNPTLTSCGCVEELNVG